ncbi:MAG: hypothetical protein ACR2K1_13685, partial [Saprospiraceae bacterium]
LNRNDFLYRIIGKNRKISVRNVRTPQNNHVGNVHPRNGAARLKGIAQGRSLAAGAIGANNIWLIVVFAGITGNGNSQQRKKINSIQADGHGINRFKLKIQSR